MTHTFRTIRNSLKNLGIDPSRPILFHASLSSLGEVQGGADTVLGALLTTADIVLSPAFTYETMLIPETGPEDNGLEYGGNGDANQTAEFFREYMPVDTSIGDVAEKLREHPRSDGRSTHPILSFTGMNAAEALESQTVSEPLAPIDWLYQQDGYVVLIGVDHTANTSIHFAEKRGGRRQFTRWALTAGGVVECPNFPGCSQGFNQAEPALRSLTKEVLIGKARVRALHIRPMIETLTDLLSKDPLALLCADPECALCNTIRAVVGGAGDSLAVGPK